ncbi:hypothetical protein [Roseivirga pacifica]|uniref:hypothetical protein n=1 Tax=Roseivirga pacifica TaxID=1267423 RepID=UPI0020964ECD|nr:hypothetical protein [Roseivirga pacifica]MCO6358756.1 hypothetical protein [Roseivirga pacifica]MCO6365608.1 hypothetical protein [Roseivirga pacifica]MCO6371662.1 hypothetical protein [Roseivirga pacifica]MCO6376227.1 hypothetical protein [Roseivirga pacifica]MCO6379040.1 hypothetical protein [Roseivirga pacifica]
MGIVEDIILVRNAVDKEWSDIIDTTNLINSLFDQAIDKLDTYEDQVKDDIESAWTELINLLETIDGSDLELILKQISLPPALKEALDALSTDLSSAEKKLDAIIRFLGHCPSLPIIPTGPPLTLLNANTFQSILEELKKAGVSVAVKPIKPRQSTDAPGKKAAKKEGKDLAEMLFSSFEGNLGTFFDNSATELGNLITQLEANIGTDVWTTLEDSVTTAIESFFESGEAKANLTIGGLISQITTLLKNDTALFKAKMAGLTENLTATKSEIVSLLKGVLNVTAAEGDLTTFFKEVLGFSSAPTLQEAVSFLVAIPLTLGAQITTGANFPKAGVLTAMNDDQKSDMRAILMIMGVVMECAEKAYEYQKDKKEQPLSWEYKAITGAIGTIQSALIQYSWYPDHGGFFSSPNKSNSIWFAQCFTGVGLSTLKWMLGVHWTRQNQAGIGIQALVRSVPAYASSYQNDYDNLKSDYAQFITTAASNSHTITQKDLTPIKDNLGSDLDEGTIQYVGEAFQKLDLPASEENVKEVLDKLESLQLNKDTDLLLSSIAKQIVAFKNADFVKSGDGKTQYENVNESIFALELQGVNLKTLKDTGKSVLGNLKDSQVSGAKHSRFLDFICPIVDIGTTLSYLVWKLVLTFEKEGDWITFDKAVFTSVLSLASSAAGIYDYKTQDKTDNQKIALSCVNNTIFGLSSFYELYEANEILQGEVTLKEVNAAVGSTTVNVAFSGAVIMKESSVKDCFSIATKAKPDVPLTISTGGAGDGEGTYTLTMDDNLTDEPLMLTVVKDAFIADKKDVKGSLEFYPKVLIISAKPDTANNKITVTFNTDVKPVGELNTESFNLTCVPSSGSPTITSVTKGTQPDSYDIALSGTLPATGVKVKTKTGAFQTANGTAVTAFFIITLPTTSS